LPGQGIARPSGAGTMPCEVSATRRNGSATDAVTVRSDLDRPPLPPMKNGEDFQTIIPNAVSDYVTSARNHEFSRSKNPARATYLRLSGQKLNAAQDSRRDDSCGVRTVLCDESAKGDQIPDCAPGPGGIHRGALLCGAVPSEGLPQDLSHFETFSCPTVRPAAKSARPS
jgi:hypothetical protein